MANKMDVKKHQIIEFASKGKIKELESIDMKVDGIQINVRDSKDNTALIIACSKGHTEVVSWLIKNNAEINLANRKKKRL